MAFQQATLPQLANLVREKFDNSNVPRCCLLIGAGCSFNSKIPLGGGLVELLKMESFRQHYISEAISWPLDKADDYKKQFDTYVDTKKLRADYVAFCDQHQDQLQKQIDNLSDDIRGKKLPLGLQKQLPEKQKDFFDSKKNEFYWDAQYEYWFRQYSENASDRQRFVERVIDGKDTGYGYVTLAHLISEGYVRNVFTTNFDDLLHDALMLFFDERVKVYAHSDLSDLLNLRDKKPNIIKLHGDFRYQDMRNTTFEIDETRNRLSEKLADALSETPCFNLVVMGYGGADVSILNQLLEAKRRTPHSPFRLIWTDRKPVEQLHWRVRDLLDTTANNFFLQIESFDLLMLQLHQALQLAQVQIVKKAQERQQEINAYYGQMKTQVNEATLSPEVKQVLTNSLQASSLFDQAYNSTDLQEQCRLYEQAIQLKPDFVNALINWGAALNELGQYEQAINKFQQALQLKPDDTDALVNWGAALNELGQYEQAINKFQQALQLKPDVANGLNNWGVALYKLGQYEQAIDKYQQALQLKPDDTDAVVNWGVTLSKLGQYEQAIDKFQQVLQLKPDDADAWFNLACVYALQEKIDETLNTLDRWRTADKSASPDKIAADTDFNRIRTNPAFEDYIRHWHHA
jgi:Tfp pilus assembly protein PilF